MVFLANLSVVGQMNQFDRFEDFRGSSYCDSLDIDECPDIVGAKGGSGDKVVVRDLSDVVICRLSGQVLRSNGML
jgi:hypothetical protein